MARCPGGSPPCSRSSSGRPGCAAPSHLALARSRRCASTRSWEPASCRRLYLKGLAASHPSLVAMRFTGAQVETLQGNLHSLLAGEEGGAGQIDQDLVRRLCCSASSGWTTLVGQISPAGGNSLEDVPVYDTSDSHHWLLVVLLRSGDRIWMLRRIYADGAAEPGKTN